MAEMLNIPVLGIVENMSYFECSACKEKHYIFGNSNIDLLCEKYNIKTISKIPMNPNLASLCDRGMIELFEGDWLDNICDVIENSAITKIEE